MLPVNSIELQQVPGHLRWRHDELKKISLLNPDEREIKEDLFFFSTVCRYSSIPLPLIQKTLVVVTGFVYDDGVGDYYHILNAAEYIKSKFPFLEVAMLIVHKDVKLPVAVKKPSVPQIEAHFFHYKHNFPTNIHQINIYEILHKADHIIEMSQKSPDPVTIQITKINKNIYKYIEEYGYSCSHNSMGVSFSNLGIIIKDKPPTSSLLDLKKVGLKQFLLCAETPLADLKTLSIYRETHELFFAYLKAGSYYQTAFIYTATALFNFSPKKTLDLIIPQIKVEYLYTEFLKQQGIAKIKTIRIQEGKITQEEITLAEQGKELRLIDPFPLEQIDFYTLLICANSLVGCTGDHSFSEAISFDRLPFYELHKWKTYFINHLMALAEHVGEEPFYLKQFFRELVSIYDHDQEGVIGTMAAYTESVSGVGPGQPDGPLKEEWRKSLNHFKQKQPRIADSALRIANLLEKRELTREAYALNDFLRDNFSFNPVLQNIIEKQLVFGSYPNLQQEEQEIRLSYERGKITLEEALEQLTEKIQNVRGS